MDIFSGILLYVICKEIGLEILLIIFKFFLKKKDFKILLYNNSLKFLEYFENKIWVI